MNDIKVTTLNTWGLLYLSKDVEKRIKHLAEELSEGEYDIVALQEVWCQRHYDYIRGKVSNVFPHTHYFHSGVVGTGLAVLSKYQIVDTFFHKFLHNGYFWDVFHGDWFAGKGLGCAIVEHPLKRIHLFNTHLHAAYGTSFSECRTLQMYETIQVIRQTTRFDDSVIICGDFNHRPDELGVEALTKLTHVRDTYEIAENKPSTLFTCGQNIYKLSKESPQRIDYIFCDDSFECKSCNATLQAIPNTGMCYSDHDGYTVTLSIKNDMSVNRKTENQDSIRVLKGVYEVISNGERFSQDIAWGKLSFLITLMLLFILFPLMSVENFQFYVAATDLNTWSGKMIFILQIVLTGFCVAVIWMVLILRRIDSKAYRNISEDIKAKIRYLEQKNHRK